MWRRLWKRFGCVALALASFTSIMPLEPARANDVKAVHHQPSTEIRVLSWNGAGAVRIERDNLDRDGFRFIEKLAERIAAEQPHLVALQEMCGSQVNALEELLGLRSYAMQLHFKVGPGFEERCPVPTLGAHPGANGRWPPQTFGKAVLTRGAATPEDSPGGRLDTCVVWTSTIPVRFCSVHLNPENVADVAGALNDWVKQGAVIVAGDFNAEPEDPEMQPMYYLPEIRPEPVDANSQHGGKFFEAGTCTEYACKPTNGEPTFPTFPRNRDLDHVFADVFHFLAPTATRSVENTESLCANDDFPDRCSDHHMVWANIDFCRPGETILGAVCASTIVPPLSSPQGDFSEIVGKWEPWQPVSGVFERLKFGADGRADYEIGTVAPDGTLNSSVARGVLERGTDTPADDPDPVDDRYHGRLYWLVPEGGSAGPPLDLRIISIMETQEGTLLVAVSNLGWHELTRDLPPGPRAPR